MFSARLFGVWLASVGHASSKTRRIRSIKTLMLIASKNVGMVKILERLMARSLRQNA
jgi:hypothetical protein